MAAPQECLSKPVMPIPFAAASGLTSCLLQVHGYGRGLHQVMEQADTLRLKADMWPELAHAMDEHLATGRCASAQQHCRYDMTS